MANEIQAAWIAAFSALVSSAAGLIGVWIGAHITTRAERRRISESNQRAAAHSAALMVGHLDRYALACLEVARDEGELVLDEDRPHKQPSRQPTAAQPAFDPLAVDGMDWKALSPALVDGIINLPYKQEEARESINVAASFDYDSMDWADTFLVRRKEYAKLGLAALKLAHELRTLAGLPVGAHSDDWSIEKGLRKQIDLVDDARRKAAAIGGEL